LLKGALHGSHIVSADAPERSTRQENIRLENTSEGGWKLLTDNALRLVDQMYIALFLQEPKELGIRELGSMSNRFFQSASEIGLRAVVRGPV